jgi:alpha-tubulin suppressor-like RCC1 family protein
MAGSQHTCAIEAAGGGGSPTTVAVCWGANGAGQVDAGNATATPKGPTLVTSGTFGSLAPTTGTTGPDFTCLIGKEGTTKCFGDNNQGQLGTSPGCLSTPVAVCEPTMSNEVFKAVSGGFAFTCALFVSNGVACFGANDSGQLGDGTHTGRNTPSYVSGG